MVVIIAYLLYFDNSVIIIGKEVEKMKYYCIGIKGAGMSTLAQILFDLGNDVSGYDDVKEYKFTQDGLDQRNIPIYYDQNHPIDKDTIVTYSAAFSPDHKEIKRVKELGLTIQSYHDILGDLSRKFQTICVAGTHGKTTTSSLITHILNHTKGCNYFIGDGSGFAKKENQLFVLESCEYQKHFLAYTPTYAVITNIELEHTECYNGLDDIIYHFGLFANKATQQIVACGDDQNIRKIAFTKEVLFYGLNEGNDLVAKNVSFSDKGSSFDVFLYGSLFGHFDLPLYGMHMVLDTLACIAICHLEGIDYETMHQLLLTFVNAKRRFKETKVGDIIVIDDYAHHPTEIKVTLNAARQKYPDKKLIAIFKPNTYSRTVEMTDDFVEALKIADQIYMTEIDANREKASDYPGVSSHMILDKIPNGKIIDEESIAQLKEEKNAVVCFMSCASIAHLLDAYMKMIA